MNWLISANENIYDLASSFADYESVDWHQAKTKYKKEDVVYIYCTSPIQRIRYKCRVTELDRKLSECRDDKDYWIEKKAYERWLEKTEHDKSLGRDSFFNIELIEMVDSERLSLAFLQKKGLKAAPRGPMKLNEALESYISSVFDTGNEEDFPDTIDSSPEIIEGLRKQVTVNKYERSSVARARCIKAHGHSCKVCNFNFEEKYGKLGKEFIHVHHITPLHTIDKSYKIDYLKELVPVCPNCHAMLHKKIDGKFYTVSELAELIKAIADSIGQEVSG